MCPERWVYIIGPNQDLQTGVAHLLRASGFEVMGFESALVFLAAVSGLARGCILINSQMPTISALALQRQLNEAAINFPVVVMTGGADIPTAVAAMKEGAVDFIEKPVEDRRLVAAVEDALAVADLVSRRGETAIAARRISALSRRERQVLDGLTEGMSAKMIAEDLGISVRTVEVHRSRMLVRLGFKRVNEAIKLSVVASFFVRMPGGF